MVGTHVGWPDVPPEGGTPSKKFPWNAKLRFGTAAATSVARVMKAGHFDRWPLGQDLTSDTWKGSSGGHRAVAVRVITFNVA